MSAQPPDGLTFTPANPELAVESVMWVKVEPKYPCQACRERGGWLPQIGQHSCPECWGEDPYGQNFYCGECEYCCGC